MSQDAATLERRLSLALEHVTDLQGKLHEMQELVKMGEAVVEDFMPNIGQCALQDYGRLNTFLVEAAKVPKP